MSMQFLNDFLSKMPPINIYGTKFCHGGTLLTKGGLTCLKKRQNSQYMHSEWLKRKVGQVVVVVIDALRADFVMPESLVNNKFSREGVESKLKRPKIPSLHELIEDESELVNAFVARANTPTVTLPRIKVSFSLGRTIDDENPQSPLAAPSSC